MALSIISLVALSLSCLQRLLIILNQQGNPRVISVLVPAKENNLEIEHVDVAPHSAQAKKVNPLGKIPVFEGANGFNLTECIAIAVYRMYLSCCA